MKKRKVRYPATVAFRTTNEIKALIEIKAAYENKTASEVLHEIVNRGLDHDLDSKYYMLVCTLASIKGKDNHWIKRKIELHHSFLKSDAHHGYNQGSAIQDIEYEIEVYKDWQQNHHYPNNLETSNC